MKILKPLGYYTDDSALRFHVLSVGEGLMILIVFPNNQTMLFDCNVTEDNEDEIVNYLRENIPTRIDSDTEESLQIIDVFVNSHRDEDHYRGLKKVNSEFPIQSIWDSGQTGATTQSDDYEYYMGLRRRLKDKDPNNLKVLVPTNIPIASFLGVKIYCLAGKEGFEPDYDNGTTIFKAATKIQHTNSIVLKISYGGTSLLLTGDSDWKSWKEKIIPAFDNEVKSEILVASHHGSRSFFTDEANDTIDLQENPDTTYLEAIGLIDPDITLISCGEFDVYHHPNEEAKALYLKHSKNGQVYTTKDCGHLLGYINSAGHYTVVPSRFRDSRSASSAFDMRIECTYTCNGKTQAVFSGRCLPVGGTLEFKLKTSGGIILPIEKIKVHWEVSNGGINSDSAHQEIYDKHKGESDGPFSFSRNLSYIGTHLLRCRLYNAQKGSITKIFVVTGVSP